MQKFRKLFRGLPDPRATNACHDLLDIMVIALAAMLCGAKGATDMALFATLMQWYSSNALSHHFLYCSSLTCSSHSTVFPFSAS